MCNSLKVISDYLHGWQLICIPVLRVLLHELIAIISEKGAAKSLRLMLGQIVIAWGGRYGAVARTVVLHYGHWIASSLILYSWFLNTNWFLALIRQSWCYRTFWLHSKQTIVCNIRWKHLLTLNRALLSLYKLCTRSLLHLYLWKKLRLYHDLANVIRLLWLHLLSYLTYLIEFTAHQWLYPRQLLLQAILLAPLELEVTLRLFHAFHINLARALLLGLRHVQCRLVFVFLVEHLNGRHECTGRCVLAGAQNFLLFFEEGLIDV